MAAAAGLDIQYPRLAHRVDFGIFKPGPNGTVGSAGIQVQVKSWSAATAPIGDSWHYPLKVPAYNYLAGKNHDIRHYLILCVVPPDPCLYTFSDLSFTALSHAAFWLSLRNEVPDLTLNPDSTKVVHVPLAHLVTPTTLRHLIEGDESMAVVP